MNAYLCDAGDLDVVVEYIDYWARHETVRLRDLVFAETRGKAKAILLSKSQGMAEFTDVSARLISSDVERQPGIARSNDPLWEDNALWSRV